IKWWLRGRPRKSCSYGLVSGSAGRRSFSEMVLTAPSFHVISLTETDPLPPASQVSIPKPSFSFKVKAFRRKSGAELFARASLVSRAHLLTQSSSSETLRESNSSEEKKFDKGFKGLRSNGRLRQQLHGAQDLHDNQQQALQRLRGFSALRKDTPSKKVVSSVPQRRHLYLDPPAHLQQAPRTEDLESFNIEKDRASTSNGFAGQNAQPAKTTGKNAQSIKRRSGRNSSRGFDVLDDLMSAQGRNSKALLESLQSEIAMENDEILSFRLDSVEDARKSPFLSQKWATRNDMAGKLGGISQMIADSRRVQRWQRIYEDTTESATVSGPFASSIEKALSPSVVAKSVHVTTNASPSNASVVQQSVKSPQLEDISNVSQPALRGQEVLWALQKAAIEKAKKKNKSRKPNDRAVRGKGRAMDDSGEWRNAKPIVLKPEWALQIDDLDRRIEMLKNPMLLS
ncbi:hypothetical protein GOP47_0027911, partial [Adiantum capillus-veneris]